MVGVVSGSLTRAARRSRGTSAWSSSVKRLADQRLTLEVDKAAKPLPAR